MAYPTKIATCCYCGTRAALVLTGKDRHELSCSGCGAPLHDLKMLRSDRVGDRELKPRPISSSPARPVRDAETRKKPAKPYQKKKRRRSLFSTLLDEAVDAIEDIFD